MVSSTLLLSTLNTTYTTVPDRSDTMAETLVDFTALSHFYILPPFTFDVINALQFLGPALMSSLDKQEESDIKTRAELVNSHPMTAVSTSTSGQSLALALNTFGSRREVLSAPTWEMLNHSHVVGEPDQCHYRNTDPSSQEPLVEAPYRCLMKVDTADYLEVLTGPKLSELDYGKKVTKVKECYPMALATPAANHRERKRFLPTALRELFSSA